MLHLRPFSELPLRLAGLDAVLGLHARGDGTLLCGGDHHDRGAALESSLHGPPEEYLPSPPCDNTILRDNRLLTSAPVLEPVVDGAAVVRAEVVDALHLETRALHVVEHPIEWSARVRSGEDVLVHEHAPDEVP